MAINWNILQPVDVGAAYDRGWDRAQKERETAALKSALAKFGQNPSDPGAQSALAAASPEFAMQMAQAKWKEQAAERERQRRAAMFADDVSGVPAGVNGQPKINFRQRQLAALRAGETEVATALGAMADDQERNEKLKTDRSKVTSEFNPITGAETYYDWQGNPVGDDLHPPVREADGTVHPHGWKPPNAAPATAPDALAALPEAGAQAPSGMPTDPNLAQTPAFDLFGPPPPNALPGENMEAYLIRKANEQIAAEPERAEEIRAQLVEMARAYRAGRQ